ncbi:hypothetical protein RRG08_063397 [Elysia crispata]|uniref:Uncharacterized protein n=1 Tax=Elysia crispata TaxID=231223 RepID=A0AAE1AY27_9GAST|nr:hypothetical protein RRG08_063397 [Elysia crispata]
MRSYFAVAVPVYTILQRTCVRLEKTAPHKATVIMQTVLHLQDWFVVFAAQIIWLSTDPRWSRASPTENPASKHA